jgi:hypothetical protein
MTAPVPRRFQPTHDDRLANVLPTHAALSNRGSNLSARPVVFGDGASVTGASGSFAVVIHQDDPAVPRPIADLVYWVGAATPANAQPYDFWYTGDV